MKLSKEEIWKLQLKDKEVSINITKLKDKLREKKISLIKFLGENNHEKK